VGDTDFERIEAAVVGEEERVRVSGVGEASNIEFRELASRSVREMGVLGHALDGRPEDP